jgi:hypothetical protein
LVVTLKPAQYRRWNAFSSFAHTDDDATTAIAITDSPRLNRVRIAFSRWPRTLHHSGEISEHAVVGSNCNLS